MKGITMRNECAEGEKLKILNGQWVGRAIRTYLANQTYQAYLLPANLAQITLLLLQVKIMDLGGFCGNLFVCLWLTCPVGKFLVQELSLVIHFLWITLLWFFPVGFDL